MPAKTPEALERKKNNRLSKKDLGKEVKIRELGGTPITIEYGCPLSTKEREVRTEYLYDLLYPSRKEMKTRPDKYFLTEGEKKERARELARKRYREKMSLVGKTVKEINFEGKCLTYTPWHTLWLGAKVRSKKKDLPFDIVPDDIKELVVDLEFCPALGIKLNWTNSKLMDDSPTLDRIVPDLGYTKGNVAVISSLANRIKSNATVDQIGKVYSWLKRTTKE